MPARPTREQCATVLDQVRAADIEWPRGKKTAWREPIEDFFDEAAFLGTLAKNNGRNDPLAEDWNWVRAQMSTLLKLAREFGAAFSDAKRELGMVDFHDLEQHALRLLWDRDHGTTFGHRRTLARADCGLFSWMNTRTSTKRRTPSCRR